MILLALIALSGVALAVIFGLFANLPTFSTTAFWQYFQYVFPYVVRGVKFVNAFMYPAVVWPLAGICLTLHVFWVGYRVVMWTLKKVPMFGITD